jgi:hypothetical protein
MDYLGSIAPFAWRYLRLTELRAGNQTCNLPIRIVIARQYVATFGFSNEVREKFLFEMYTKPSLLF